jgi:hypothetical protein
MDSLNLTTSHLTSFPIYVWQLFSNSLNKNIDCIMYLMRADLVTGDPEGKNPLAIQN